ncbi:MAG TPA: isoprenylcysteine carboxylmethyltransferase family protein [Parvularculaceae bacterium]|nr:isoprenylcysteine carboxylmethyltransferase family protein [Parvularculaceae bacterium]
MGPIILVISVIVYAIFFAAFLYLVAFVGGDMIPLVHVPKTLDWGASLAPGAPAALINIGVLLLFALQHSIMARGGFKRGWIKIVPPPLERSAYVLATVVVLVVIYAYWAPMPAVVWSVTSPIWSGVLIAAFYIGFGMVLLSTFLINHFELFGLYQAWKRLKKEPIPKPEFRTPLLYRFVRHPLYLGFLIAFWATPTMTVGHLLFSAIWTFYIFIAIGYEERDLIGLFGEKYADYMRKTPSILPFGGRRQ